MANKLQAQKYPPVGVYVGVWGFAVCAGGAFADVRLVDAGFLYGETRVGGVGPPGSVVPGEGEDDRWLVASFVEGDVHLRTAQRSRDRVDSLKMFGFVEEVYARPEAVRRLGRAPPALVL